MPERRRRRRTPSAHLVRRVLALAHPIQFHRRAVPGENLTKQKQTGTEINTDELWPQKQDKGPLGLLTAILDRGGTGTQPSGGSSVPKISAVPVTRRTRRGASGSTSTRSSLCGASLYCRGGCGVAAPAPAAVAAAMVRGFWRRRDGEGLGVAGAGGLMDFGGVRDRNDIFEFD